MGGRRGWRASGGVGGIPTGEGAARRVSANRARIGGMREMRPTKVEFRPMCDTDIYVFVCGRNCGSTLRVGSTDPITAVSIAIGHGWKRDWGSDWVCSRCAEKQRKKFASDAKQKAAILNPNRSEWCTNAIEYLQQASRKSGEPRLDYLRKAAYNIMAEISWINTDALMDELIKEEAQVDSTDDEKDSPTGRSHTFICIDCCAELRFTAPERRAASKMAREHKWIEIGCDDSCGFSEWLCSVCARKRRQKQISELKAEIAKLEAEN